MDSKNNIENNIGTNIMELNITKYSKISNSILENPNNMYINEQVKYSIKKFCDNINDSMIDDFLIHYKTIPKINKTKIEKKQLKIKDSNDADDKINKFFDCFNEELSINNTIACDNLNVDNDSNESINELTTSYVFDNCDLKKKREIDPFINEEYTIENYKNKKKKNNTFGLVAFSTALFMGRSWWNNL